jgi:hypothetical protein
MQINDNQRKRLYDKESRTWYEVSAKQYKEFDQWRTNLRKRMQYQHKCCCPRNKWWLCDGMCDYCEFYTPKTVSLDAPLADGEGTLANYVPSNCPTPEDITSDRELLDRLIKRLYEIDPEADRIIEIWMDHPEGISDRKVAETLGRKQRTFADEMKKFRNEFKNER